MSNITIATRRESELTSFLELNDFGKIRSSYETYLLNGKQVIFTLREGNGSTEFEMEII